MKTAGSLREKYPITVEISEMGDVIDPWQPHLARALDALRLIGAVSRIVFRRRTRLHLLIKGFVYTNCPLVQVR